MVTLYIMGNFSQGCNLAKESSQKLNCPSHRRFLRNPTELKSIKNISLLRQQMEAQAAAQKLAAQHAANAALRSLTPAAAALPSSAAPTAADPADLEDGVAAVQPESPPPGSGGVLSSTSSSDEPTDLTMDAEEKALRNRDRIERELRY